MVHKVMQVPLLWVFVVATFLLSCKGASEGNECYFMDVKGPCNTECGEGMLNVSRVLDLASYSKPSCAPYLNNITVFTAPCTAGQCDPGQFCAFRLCLPNWRWVDSKPVPISRNGAPSSVGASMTHDDNDENWLVVWYDSSNLFWSARNSTISWNSRHVMSKPKLPGYWIAISSPEVAYKNGTWVIMSDYMAYNTIVGPDGFGTSNATTAILVSTSSDIWNPSSWRSEIVAATNGHNDPSPLVAEGSDIMLDVTSHGYVIAYSRYNATPTDTWSKQFQDVIVQTSSDGVNWNSAVIGLTNISVPAIYAIAASDSTLMLVHVNSDGNMLAHISKDFGQTWKSTNVNTAPGRLFTPSVRLFTDRQGTWLMFYEIEMGKTFVQRFLEGSNEDGQWAKPYQFSSEVVLQTVSALAAVGNGTGIWTVTWPGYQANFTDGLTALGMVYSTYYSFSRDNGVTWTTPKPATTWEKFETPDPDIGGARNDFLPVPNFAVIDQRFKRASFASSSLNKTLSFSSIFIDPCYGVDCIPTDGYGNYFILPWYNGIIPTNFTKGNLWIIGFNVSVIYTNASLFVSGSTVVLTGAQVGGDLTIAGSVIVVSGHVLNVSVHGCLNLEDVVFDISNTSDNRVTLFHENSCIHVKNVSTTIGLCATINVIESRIDISFGCSDDADIGWKIATGIVVPLVVITFVILAVVALRHPKLRAKLFPYRDRPKGGSNRP